MTRPRLRSAVLVAAFTMASILTPGAPPAQATPAEWTPDPARYGVGEQINQPIVMSDGTVLRGNVYYPTEPATGEPAPGPFPVVLTQTPYGKDKGINDPSLGATGMGKNPYLIERGYIQAIVDVRGTGASEGAWSFLQPVEANDSVPVIRWAANLPHSSGAVGLIGQSYSALNQLMAAGTAGRNSPLKAILPIVPGDDLYRDILGTGGVPNPLLAAEYLAVNVPQSYLNALQSALLGYAQGQSLDNLLQVLVEHGASLGVLPIGDLLTGGPNAYDSTYWAARRPHDVLADIVANQVPAMIIGGWHDAFQRGTPLLYSGLQNAWRGRPTYAPMTPDQPVTSRYQLVQGPWFHSTVAVEGVHPYLDVSKLALRWFDHWLKGRPTGITDTTTPLHSYDLGADRWIDTTSYPFRGATPTRFYLGAGRSGTIASSNDGTLTSAPPQAGGTDTVVWSNVPHTCTPSTTQFVLLGADQTPGSPLAPNPCVTDARPVQLGPDAATYTSPPMTTATTIAGPIAAHIYATATTIDTQWVVRVDDVAPDGTSKPLTRGGLLGSLRVLDESRTWRTADGTPTLPYHPYTAASAQPMLPGTLTPYDIEVFPTMATIAPGHRIRVTIGTDDAPALIPTITQTLQLIGGVYQIHRSPVAASYVELPLADPAALSPTCTDQTTCPVS